MNTFFYGTYVCLIFLTSESGRGIGATSVNIATRRESLQGEHLANGAF